MSTTIEVNPTRVDMRIHRGKSEDASLIIRNTSGETQDYRVQAEGVFGPWINELKPDFFPLHADDTQDVPFTVIPPSNSKLGTHSYELLVFNDNDETDRVAVPVQINVPIPIYWWIIGVVVVLVILLLLLWQAGLFG